jgi:Mg/Co/Ni transporter MgtE
MNNLTVEEIESAIEQLPEAELKRLASWFDNFQARVWDEQIADDLQNGRLKNLIEQAENDFAAGVFQELPISTN